VRSRKGNLPACAAARAKGNYVDLLLCLLDRLASQDTRDAPPHGAAAHLSSSEEGTLEVAHLETRKWLRAANE